MLIKFGYMMMGAMVLVVICALCIEIRDTWEELRQWLKK